MEYLIVVNKFLSRKTSSDYLTSLLQKVVSLVDHEELSIVVTHIYREANRCANKLVNLNLNENFSIVDLPTLSSSVLVLLDDD